MGAVCRKKVHHSMEIMVDVVDVLLGGAQVLMPENALNGLCTYFMGVSKD